VSTNFAEHGAILQSSSASKPGLDELIRSKDWSKTLIGSQDQWSPTLRTIVNFLTANRFPMLLWWGPDYVSIYNDAYRPILGTKHPNALGKPFREVWPEIKDILSPLIDSPFNGGPATWMEDILLEVNRHGFTEETHFTIAYSPVPDDTAPRGIGGVLATVHEITEKVVGERRISALRDLGARTDEGKTVEEVCVLAVRALHSYDKDIPFGLIYLLEPNGETAKLAATAGIPANAPAAKPSVSVTALQTSGEPWPLASVLGTRSSMVVENIDRGLLQSVAGPWSEPPHTAAVVPIRSNLAERLTGFLVAGISPRLHFNDQYQSFLDLAAAQIAAKIASARAYEEERARAESLAIIDRAKTAFFSNVSHEFRTPLTLMLGPLEDVIERADGLPAEHRATLNVVHRNGIRLLKLVNTLLDFARIEAGRVTAAYEAVDLGQLTAELASNFRSATDRAGLQLAIEMHPLPQPVYVDVDMWEKIVLNLLSNAFKFTFVGEIGVAVKPASDGTHVDILVHDTGTGISPVELPHLFERFRRVEGAQGRSFEGSGIGLALVQELVKLHSGTIAVESELGRGTTFTISVPFGTAHLSSEYLNSDATKARTNLRAQAYVDEAMAWLEGSECGDHPAASSTEDDGLPVAKSSAARRSRVLLADDNADMREYIRRLLSDQYEVETVADGEQALDAATRNRPDLVLSDIMMPKLDGFGFLAALRKSRELRDVPVIFLSARAGEEAKIEGLRHGADDYLIKPFNASELLARVAANIELSGSRIERARLFEEETRILEILNNVGGTVAAELNLDRAVQFVTDAGTQLTGAGFGAFFYNVIDGRGDSYTLYTISGVPRETFSKFQMPRVTEVFAPTFSGNGIVRSDDILKDPRYGKSEPHRGMPKGHLPVRSYLAAPVVSRSGEVLGGLFFGHEETGKFTERSERLLAGIAAQAAIAIDNARLFQAAEREVAERRTAEAALQTLNATLEQRVSEEVRERTKAEEQLRQVQKMEMIGQLTGGIAHDFNNLLMAVLGNLELLRKYIPGDPRTARLIDGASQGAQRGATLTQRLLAFARKQDLQVRPTDIVALVKGMTGLFERSIGSRIELFMDLPQSLPPALIDSNQVELALLNLAVNARDAMPDGGTLSIKAEALLAPSGEGLKAGVYIRLSVADTGRGMSPETLAKATEPFFSTKGVGKGTGLGLSMVQGLAVQLEGALRLSSEEGKGTIAELLLPVTHLALTSRDETGTAIFEEQSNPGMTILVVDDDALIAMSMSDMLEDLGHKVIEANSGERALEILGNGQSLDLMITDYSMPKMTGTELAVKARELRPGMPILLATGYAELPAGTEIDLPRLSKPYQQGQLAAEISKVVKAQVA
jgi:signal transduction histidine kinase/DNA-binding response OmpR family regulator